MRGARGRLEDRARAFRELEDRYRSGTAGADDLAMLAAVLGDGPAALAWLTEACAQRAPFLGYVEVEPAMQPLLQDPACRALLQRTASALGRNASVARQPLVKTYRRAGGQEEFIFSFPALLHGPGKPGLQPPRSSAPRRPSTKISS